jgi:predicted nucleotidyltransferase
MQEEYKKKLIDLIEKRLPECTIILYGSRARDDARTGSDIDLALDCGKEVDRAIIIDLLEDIENSVVPYKIDLVDLHTIKGDLGKEIERDGVIWKKA